MKRPTKTKVDNALLTALKSVSAITKNDGTVLETHVVLANGWVTASNGIIGIGEKVEHDLACAPHASKLISALSKCGSSISITQLDVKLSITSGPFRAQVPFVSIENLTRAFPDQSCGPLDNRLRVSFETVADVPEKEETPLTASVLLSGGSVFGTDRTVILESYHGIHLPVLAIPKSFVKITKAIKKNYKSFGFSNNSFTIYLEDDSWIKTQLWNVTWPDVASILNTQSNMMVIPEEFWNGLDAVEAFSEEGWAFSRNGKICSHDDESVGASYECYGLPPNFAMSIKQLQATKDWAKKIDFFARSTNGQQCIKIVGDETRAVIAGRRE